MVPHARPSQLTATTDQVKAARRLVRAMHLAEPATSTASQPAAPRHERLRPEDTANPLLQRFYYWLGRKLLDPAFSVSCCCLGIRQLWLCGVHTCPCLL